MKTKTQWLTGLFSCCITVMTASVLFSCEESPDIPEDETAQSEEMSFTNPILEKLATEYERMKEREVAISTDSSVYAQYAAPTSRYAHGILGDAIEAAQLVVVVNDTFHTVDLSDSYVFEDIRPRLVNVDDEPDLEVVCIRSHVDLGAGIVIYKLVDNALTEFATVPEIGIRNRWLNIAAIDDLNADGKMDIAWIQTPHIGGRLKVGRIDAGIIEPLDEVSFYSNHGIGETNLCLSAMTLEDNVKIVYVPTQRRDSLVGFSFDGQAWMRTSASAQHVDFSLPLIDQVSFENLISDDINCIAP